MSHIQLYKQIKGEKNRVHNIYIKDFDFARGIQDSLYDLMNYVSSIKR